MPDISVAQYGCVRQHLVFDNLLSTPAFDCNMGCHLAGDHLVGRFSGNLLDATLGGGFDIIVDLVKTDCMRLAGKLSATIRSLDICAPAALRSIARRHVAGG